VPYGSGSFVVMDQPINIIAHHIEISGQRQELGASPGPPGLDSANFMAVQHDCVVSTPPAKGSDFSAGHDRYVRLDSLLKRHSAMAPFALMPTKRGKWGLVAAFILIRKKPKIVKRYFRWAFGVGFYGFRGDFLSVWSRRRDLNCLNCLNWAVLCNLTVRLLISVRISSEGRMTAPAGQCLMIIPYSRYKVGGYLESLPLVSVLISCNRKRQRVWALIDSGSDMCVFNLEIADLLSIDPNKGKRYELTGLVGGSVGASGHQVNVVVSSPLNPADKLPGVDINVIFSTSLQPVPALLGQKGFFDNFQIRFRRYNNEMELFPKGGGRV
jgi:hypothetical protein